MRIRRERLGLYWPFFVFVGIYIFWNPLQRAWESDGGAFAFVFAVIGIVAAISAWTASFKLQSISDSLSTQYVGSFPDNVAAITSLVDGARHTIEVFTDCVDYGSLMPKLHRHLLEALKRAIRRPKKTFFSWIRNRLGFEKRNVKITFLVWGKPKSISDANRFSDPKMVETTEFRNMVQEFCRDLPRYQRKFIEGHKSEFELLNCLTDAKKPASCTNIREALEKVLISLHEWEVDELKGAKVSGQYFNKPKVSDKDLAKIAPPDFLFWIRDGKEAVVLFPVLGENALALLTREPVFVRRLREIFDAKYRAATGEPRDSFLRIP
jgi:hypothetical protein